MYDFKLKYAKLHNSGHFGHCDTGTALIGTGTDLVLLGGTGTACTGTGTDWLLLGGTGTALFWYRYHFGKLPRIASFSLFWYHCSSYNTIFHNTSRINMEFIQNHSITLVLVVWNLNNQTLGKNPKNST